MNANTFRRIAHETGMFGPEFNVTGEQCDKFAMAVVEAIARQWDGCMAPMFDAAGNPTGPIDIGATIREDHGMELPLGVSDEAEVGREAIAEDAAALGVPGTFNDQGDKR